VLLRMAIGGSATERRHVEQAWQQIRWEHAALAATLPGQA
jgi:aromatic-L-amino-acid decarboxylase